MNQREVALPSQSNGQMEEAGSHTAQSFGRGIADSFCPHKMDSAEQPSREKEQLSG